MAQAASGLTEAGRLERALLGIGARRDRFASHVTRGFAALLGMVRLGGRILLWAVTLRLPGEMGYWLRARRRRRPLLRGFLGRRFALPNFAEPSVSVIIPTYGQVPMTRRCLASIAAYPPKAAIEVIVIDDCSGDKRLARLARIRGPRLLATPRNLGFIGACNHAAGFARGEFLLFLNNDTQVRAGWLDSLRDLLLVRPDAGAAGSKLLSPDGTLQEAGGVIWADGSGANVGRGDDPRKPVYNYVREVDYASGASLMIRRHLFEELGGFDPLYAPAYYEDADIAFRLRARGHATLYQPRSEVVHIEGVSHGTDPRAGIKAHQVLNQDRFVARWGPVLKAQHMPRGTRSMRARDHAGARAVVLVVEHCVPEPDRDAGSQTMLAFLRALCATSAVVKLWVEVIRRPERRYITALQDMGVEVLAGGPTAFEAWLAENGAELDRVLLSRPDVAATHLGAIRRHCAAHVAYYGHDLHHRRLRAQFAVSGAPSLVAEAARMEHLERWLWRATDTVLMPSSEEAELIAAAEPGARALAVSPYAFAKFGERRPPPDCADLLFVGGFAHSPNEDAVVWVATEVLPLVRAHVPDVRLLAAGSRVTPRIWSLAGPGVVIHADVTPDALRELYVSARVAVAPLRYGAGVKLKVVEALREGTPLVTTPTGAQGLPNLDEVIDVAADAPSFAAAVCRLLTDDALWEARCAGQISYAAARFGVATLRDGLLDALGLPVVAAEQPNSKSAPRAHRGSLVGSISAEIDGLISA